MMFRQTRKHSQHVHAWIRGGNTTAAPDCMVIGSYKLMSYLPFRILAVFNGVPEILPVVIRVLAGRCLSFLPDQARFALKCLPVEFDELAVAAVGDEAKSMHAEAVHMPKGTNNSVSCHSPEERVQCTRLTAEEVPSSIMSSGSLRNLAVRLRLDGVDQIGK